jgi:hypothetical protein
MNLKIALLCLLLAGCGSSSVSVTTKPPVVTPPPVVVTPPPVVTPPVTKPPVVTPPVVTPPVTKPPVVTPPPVVVPPAAPTLKIAANPTTVVLGSSSTLTWSSTNATTCTASGGWTGKQATSGSLTITPASTTTYSLTCAGATGTTPATQSVSITVNPPPAPTLKFTVNPTVIVSGNSSTLTWLSTNATACTASGGWTGSELLTGSLIVSPTTNTTYSLTCVGAKGTTPVSNSVSLTVNQPPPVVNTANLSWTVPTNNTDGSIASLSGFIVYYGQDMSNLTSTINIAGATTDTAEITNLTKGTWYFVVVAVGTDGMDSADSNVAMKTF